MNYEKSINLDPYNPISYRKKVVVLIKMGKISDALAFLENLKKSKYYVTNNMYMPIDWFIKTIDELIIDCKDKIENNYVYKPRKFKIDYVD